MDQGSARANLQNLINNFQTGGAQSAPQRTSVNDQSAFVNPYSNALVGFDQKVPRNGGDGHRPQDASIVRQRQQLASQFAKKLGQRMDADPYLGFLVALKDMARRKGARVSTAPTMQGEKSLLENVTEAPLDSATSSKKQQSRQEETGEEIDESASEEATSARSGKTYSPPVQKILQLAQNQSREITEQFNLLDFALSSMELDVGSYTRQLQKARANLDRLQERRDFRAAPKIQERQQQIIAMESELAVVTQLRSELASAVSQMKAFEGKRITDGFNLIPKAVDMLDEMRPSANVTGIELAATYRDEVLNLHDPAEFFENFMQKHATVGFRPYIGLILDLLGNDISSINPSRNPNQLKAVRDGIYMAEISNEVFERVGVMDLRYDRILTLREKEMGTYNTHYLVMDYAPEKISLLNRGGDGQARELSAISIGGKNDPYGEIRQQLDGQRIDEIIFGSSMETRGKMTPDQKKEMNTFLRAIRVAYGLPIRKAEGDSPQIMLNNYLQQNGN